MSESELRPAELEASDLGDEGEMTGQQEQALELYCRMKVPRHTEIARRVGASRHQIARWVDKYNWIEIRDARLRDRREKLIAEVGDPAETDKQFLIMNAQILLLLARKIRGAEYARVKDLKEMVDVLNGIIKHQHALFDRLGLDGSKLTPSGK